MWLGEADQETRLGNEGPGCKCKGQARGFDAMDHRGGQVRVEGVGTDGLSATVKSKRGYD